MGCNGGSRAMGRVSKICDVKRRRKKGLSELRKYKQPNRANGNATSRRP